MHIVIELCLLTLSDFIQTVLPVYLKKHLFVSN